MLLKGTVEGLRRRRSRLAFDDDLWRRVRLGLAALSLVTVVGTVGYTALGLHPAEALYMTVVTISTVGFGELADDPTEIDTAYRLFTTGLILVGVGTALYTLSVTLETVLESRLTDLLRRRRMDREIETMKGHVVVCGYGRLGRTIARRIAATGQHVVVIDRDEDRLVACPHHYVLGDGTVDEVLVHAGIDHAGTLIAATDSDSDNLYITLGVRTRCPDLFIVARAKLETAEPKLLQAGANRVVNPQLIGGERIAALTLDPHVSEFLDVVMHDEGIEFRLESIELGAGSSLVRTTLRDSHLRDQTGAMVLAIRQDDGSFLTNPEPSTVLEDGSTLIAIGTPEQLARLTALADAAG